MQVELNKVRGDLYFGSDPKYQINAHNNTRSGTGSLLGRTTCKWFASDGKDEWLGCPGLDFDDVLLSRKPPATSMKVKMKTPGVAPILLGFTSTEDRAVFTNFVAECKASSTLADDTAVSSSSTGADVKKILLPLTDDIKPVVADDNKEDIKAEANVAVDRPAPGFIQRDTELRQLYSTLVSTGIIAQEEFLSAQQDTENEATVALEAQRLGQTSVYAVLNELVDPKTRILKPMSEEVLANVFHQVPLFAKLYKARVQTRSDEFVFWDAVLRRVLFLASSNILTVVSSKVAGVVVDVDAENEEDSGASLSFSDNEKSRVTLAAQPTVDLTPVLLDAQQAPGFGTRKEREKAERGLYTESEATGGESGSSGRVAVGQAQQILAGTAAAWNFRSTVVAQNSEGQTHDKTMSILGHSRLSDLQAVGNEDVAADRDAGLLAPKLLKNDGDHQRSSAAITSIVLVEMNRASQADLVTQVIQEAGDQEHRQTQVRALIQGTSCGDLMSNVQGNSLVYTKKTTSSKNGGAGECSANGQGKDSTSFSHLIHVGDGFCAASTQRTVAALVQQYWLSRNLLRKGEFIKQIGLAMEGATGMLPPDLTVVVQRCRHDACTSSQVGQKRTSVAQAEDSPQKKKTRY